MALLAGFVTMAAIQPSRDARPPTQPAWADVAAFGILMLLLVAFIALLSDRTWGFGAATYGSAGLVFLSALCPTWDHHQIGWWWIGQSIISVAMLAGSVIQRSRVPRAAMLVERPLVERLPVESTPVESTPVESTPVERRAPALCLPTEERR